MRTRPEANFVGRHVKFEKKGEYPDMEEQAHKELAERDQLGG